MRALAREKLPAWLQAELPETPPEHLDAQERRERQILLATDPPDWSALVAARLLPW